MFIMLYSVKRDNLLAEKKKKKIQDDFQGKIADALVLVTPGLTDIIFIIY